MAATLKYDIAVVGAANINAALANVERRFSQHNKRVMGGAAGRGAGRAAAGQAEVANETTKEARLAAIRKRYHDASVAYNKKLETSRHREKLRNIEREKQAEINAARAANARAVSNRRAMRGAVGQAAIGSVSTIGRGAATVAALGGSAIIASGIQKQIDVSSKAAMLANKAFGTPGETRSRDQIQASLMQQSKQIGDVTGNRAGVIEAIDKFVAISGSLKGGQALAGFMANVSDATGAEMSDVGQTGGQILQNIMATRGVSANDTEAMNKALEDTQSIMLAMAGHAKIGSIEFADLATQMGKVMSSTSRFEGDVADLANQMGAIAQLAIAGGASSPEEAMTSIMRFSDDLIQNASRFDKLARNAGIKESFFTDKTKTKLRDPTDIMMNILDATQGDLTKVKKVFGIRAMKAVEPFQQSYVSARQGGATHEQAIAQVKTTIGRFKGSAMTKEEAAASATFARTQTGRSFQIEWEKLTQEAGEQLAPALTELIPSVRELAGTLKQGVPYVKRFFEQLAANPISTIGKVLAAKVLLDVGQAAIGQAIKTAIANQIATSGAASALTGVGDSAKSAKGGIDGFGAAATAAAIGIAAASGQVSALIGNLEGGSNQTGMGEFESIGNFLANVLPTGWAAQVAGDVAGGRGIIESAKDTGAGKAVMGWSHLLSGGFNDDQNRIAKKEASVRDARAELEAVRAQFGALTGENPAAQKAAIAQEQAAIKLSAAADKLNSASQSPVPRGDQPAPPVK